MIQSEVPKDKTPRTSRANGHAEPDTHPPPAELPIDVRKLSNVVLRALVADAPPELERREAELADSLRAEAETLGITPERLVLRIAGKVEVRPRSERRDRRADVKAKYWNPKDHSQTWSGRGETPPQWFRDLLAAGVTREDMLIPEGAL
jgi:DNA-binding protein H-NS